MKQLVLRPNFEKGWEGKLVGVIAQHATTMEILMFAWTDEAGWKKTLETGLGTYYSRSRNRSWIKGEESGNFQKVVGMCVDCDGDALVYFVEPKGDGVACHTKARSCFYRSAINTDVREPAPEAGPKEELQSVEVEVSEDLVTSDRRFFRGKR